MYSFDLILKLRETGLYYITFSILSTICLRQRTSSFSSYRESQKNWVCAHYPTHWLPVSFLVRESSPFPCEVAFLPSPSSGGPVPDGFHYPETFRKGFLASYGRRSGTGSGISGAGVLWRPRTLICLIHAVIQKDYYW